MFHSGSDLQNAQQDTCLPGPPLQDKRNQECHITVPTGVGEDPGAELHRMSTLKGDISLTQGFNLQREKLRFREGG